MKIEKLVRSIFVRQIAKSDCGLACLTMVLNYSNTQVTGLATRWVNNENKYFSLLELKQLAASCGLSSKCVALDMTFLRTNQKPCILHIVNQQGSFHYIVCFGSRIHSGRYEYLIADPAAAVYYIPEGQLLEQWRSGAALYFDTIAPQDTPQRKPFWIDLFSGGLLPAISWFIVPALSILFAIFSVALSWILQKGMDNTLNGQKQSVINAIVLLLLVIVLSKGILAYVKQRLIILLNRGTNEKLFLSLLEKIAGLQKEGKKVSESFIKASLGDLQKIQFALNTIIAVWLSDGAILLTLLGMAIVYFPLVGLFNGFYLLLLVSISCRKQAAHRLDVSQLAILAANAESSVYRSGQDVIRTELAIPGNPYQSIRDKYDLHSRLSQYVNGRLNHYNLIFDSVGALTLIGVFAYGLAEVRGMVISYATFMLMVFCTYFMTILSGRICNSFPVIVEGGYALRLLKERHAASDRK